MRKNGEMNNSLKYNALKVIAGHFPDWVGGIVLEDYALKNGFKSSNVSRRLRELRNEGRIEARYVNGYVEYKWKKPPVLSREEEEKRILQAALL